MIRYTEEWFTENNWVKVPYRTGEDAGVTNRYNHYWIKDKSVYKYKCEVELKCYIVLCERSIYAVDIKNGLYHDKWNHPDGLSGDKQFHVSLDTDIDSYINTEKFNNKMKAILDE